MENKTYSFKYGTWKKVISEGEFEASSLRQAKSYASRQTGATGSWRFDPTANGWVKDRRVYYDIPRLRLVELTTNN